MALHCQARARITAGQRKCLAGASMGSTTPLSFIDAAKGLATQILAAANEIEQSRRLPASLVDQSRRPDCFTFQFRVPSAAKKLIRSRLSVF